MWRASANRGPVTDDATQFDVVVRGRSANDEREARASGAAIYDLTAKIVADTACALVDRGALDKNGVLSPAQFFEPRRFLRDLEGYGVATAH